MPNPCWEYRVPNDVCDTLCVWSPWLFICVLFKDAVSGPAICHRMAGWVGNRGFGEDIEGNAAGLTYVLFRYCLEGLPTTSKSRIVVGVLTEFRSPDRNPKQYCFSKFDYYSRFLHFHLTWSRNKHFRTRRKASGPFSSEDC